MNINKKIETDRVRVEAIGFQMIKARIGVQSAIESLSAASIYVNDADFIKEVLDNALLNCSMAEELVHIYSRLKKSDCNIYEEVIDFIDQNIDSDDIIKKDEYRCIEDCRIFHLVLVILSELDDDNIVKVAEIFKKQLPEMDKIIDFDIHIYSDDQIVEHVKNISSGNWRIEELKNEIKIKQDELTTLMK